MMKSLNLLSISMRMSLNSLKVPLATPKKVHVFHSQTTNQVMALTQPDIQYFSSEYSKVFSSSDIIVKPMQWIVNHSV